MKARFKIFWVIETSFIGQQSIVGSYLIAMNKEARKYALDLTKFTFNV